MKPRNPTEKGRINVGRFSVPYRVYGNGGPNLVCINGVQQSMAMWHSFINRFSHHYHIVLFDFPGQGKGEITVGDANVSVDEQVEILHGVITAANIRQITLCSASWGGVVAMAYAVKYPDMVKRLILSGMGTRPNKALVEVIQKGCAIDTEKREDMAKLLIKAFGDRLPETIKEKISRQFLTMSRENLQAFSEHGLFVIAAADLGRIIDFKRIQADTFLLNGEKDTIIDLEDVKFLSTQIPNCRLKIVKGVGHFMHLESERVFSVYDEVLQ